MTIAQDNIQANHDRRSILRDGNAESLRAIAVLLAIIVGCRFILAASVELAEDEAYYWLWSTYLSTGYYDHPPMIAYWIRAGTLLFGQTEFGIRFICLLSMLAASALMYYGSLSLFRDRGAAALCVVWLNATLLANAAAILATPDTPLAFFTGCAVFALAKLAETNKGAWWYAVGAALGAAALSKYTAILLLPGLFFWLIALPQNRRWLRRPEPYIGALIAIVIIAPMVYWNYVHDWVSFAKQAQHGIKDKPANAIGSVIEFLGGQAGLATPIIFGFCVFGMIFSVRRGWVRGHNGLLLVGLLSAPAFAFFLIHAASQKIQPNWPAFLYGTALIAAVNGFSIYRRERRAPAAVVTAFRLAPMVGAAFTVVALLQLGLGVLPIGGKQDPTARLKGWSKLADDVEALRVANGANAILTDRYALTGELAYYTERPEAVFQANERIRYTNLAEPQEEALQQPTLFVTRKGQEPQAVFRFFAGTSLLTTLTRDTGVLSRDMYDVYLLHGYTGGLFNRAPGSAVP